MLRLIVLVLLLANGVYFAPGSSVDVGAITATTHSISDDNFMSGKYVFERKGATGKVVNEGNITAALSGYVALLAPRSKTQVWSWHAQARWPWLRAR
mgnify:CR=1 FL=1